MNCRLSKESTDVCVRVCVKDDPKSRCIIRFIFSGRMPQQIRVAHMKTKTTEISFTDYNVNTTGALFLVPILFLTFSQEIIMLQYSARSGVAKILLCRYISPSRATESFTTLSDNFNERKAALPAFLLNLTRSNFYQIINFAKNFRPGDTRATRVTIPIGTN